MLVHNRQLLNDAIALNEKVDRLRSALKQVSLDRERNFEARNKSMQDSIKYANEATGLNGDEWMEAVALSGDAQAMAVGYHKDAAVCDLEVYRLDCELRRELGRPEYDYETGEDFVVTYPAIETFDQMLGRVASND